MPAHSSVGVPGGPIYVEDYPNFFTGTAASDTLVGTSGNDIMNGNGGNDSFVGGAGDDLFRGGSGVDSYDGGAGFDRVSFYRDASATHGVIASLLTQTVYDDGFGNTEHMTSIEGLGLGTLNPDVFIGDNNPNFLYGGKADVLLALGGDDVITVDEAPALVDGGTGTNTLILSASRLLAPTSGTFPAQDFATHGVTVDLAAHQIVDDGFGGSGTILNIQNVYGSSLDDVIKGDSNDNVLMGEYGNDTLSGGGGNDVFYYVDLPGADPSTPGPNGHDVITDFRQGHDKIAINMASVHGMGDLTITGGGGHSDVVITFGPNADTITLQGVHHVNASDFIFGPI